MREVITLMGTDLKTYKILSERHLNDDRLMNERSSIFIASSSILFAGFAVLNEGGLALRIVICILGVILSGLAIRANYRTSQGLGFWDEKEREIEENSEEEPFTYMRDHKMMAHGVYKRAGGCLRNRHIYTYCVPLVFILLWVGSFVWALVASA